MATTIRYPEDYIKFIGTLGITPNYKIINRGADTEPIKISRYYTPQESVGELSRRVLESAKNREINVTKQPVPEGSLIHQALHTDLLREYSQLEVYFQVILLEILSLEIAIEHVPELRRFVISRDIGKVRETICYVLDVLDVNPKYPAVIENLQEAYISLGYIQAQAGIIREDRGESTIG